MVVVEGVVVVGFAVLNVDVVAVATVADVWWLGRSYPWPPLWSPLSLERSMTQSTSLVKMCV